MEAKVAIALAGQIGSGKSTISRAVAETLRRPLVSFSAEVRAAAVARGLPSGRKGLQELGEILIAEGWDSFCSGTLAQAGNSLTPPIIDGVRHQDAIQSLRKLLAPTPIVIVFLDVPKERRVSRLIKRGQTIQEIEKADQHPTEAELPLVRAEADLLLINDGSIEEVVEEFVLLLGS